MKKLLVSMSLLMLCNFCIAQMLDKNRKEVIDGNTKQHRKLVKYENGFLLFSEANQFFYYYFDEYDNCIEQVIFTSRSKLTSTIQYYTLNFHVWGTRSWIDNSSNLYYLMPDSLIEEYKANYFAIKIMHLPAKNLIEWLGKELGAYKSSFINEMNKNGYKNPSFTTRDSLSVVLYNIDDKMLFFYFDPSNICVEIKYIPTYKDILKNVFNELGCKQNPSNENIWYDLKTGNIYEYLISSEDNFQMGILDIINVKL